MKTNAAKDRGDATIVFELLRSLWDLAHDDPRRRILPTDADSLRDFHRHLAEFIETVPHDLSGTIDSQAIVRGKIVAMGEGSRIEAGAVIHD